ncbi:unnamed protein product [Meloidogyne enterolobii]|uniref:Uncharacterized protein n=1 Tax=Meloidogyne enterolobii TaxID=390850 RepID=A0ACB1ALH0_MELEN
MISLYRTFHKFYQESSLFRYALHYYVVPNNQHIENQKKMILKAKSKGIGTFISEYGDADVNLPAPLKPNEMKSFWAFMDQNKLSYCKWSLSNKDEVYSLVLPYCTPDQANQEKCLSPSGKLLRGHMKNQRNGSCCVNLLINSVQILGITGC